MVLDIADPSFISNDIDVDNGGDYEEAPEAEEPNSGFQKLKKDKWRIYPTVGPYRWIPQEFF